MPEVNPDAIHPDNQQEEGGVQAPLPTVLQHVPLPQKLELKDMDRRKEEWDLFKQMWENYEISSGLERCPNRVRVATFLNCFSPTALKVYNQLDWEQPEDKTDISKVTEKFQELCKGVINETYERYIFNTRSQNAEESVDDYYVALQELSKQCNYGTLRASLIRDRLVCGIRDSGARRKLLQEKNLDLARCLDILRSSEAAAAHLSSMQAQSSAQSAAVNRMQFSKKKDVRPKTTTTTKSPASPPKARYHKKHNKQPRTGTGKKCFFCNHEYHDRSECPAKDATCDRCSKTGHYGVACRSSASGGRGIREVVQYSDREEQFLGSINTDSNKQHSGHTVVAVDGTDIEFRIDSGADVDVIPSKVFHKYFPKKMIYPSRTRLRPPDNPKGEIAHLGYMKCELRRGEHTVQSKVYVLNSGSECLLSKDSSIDLKVIAFLASIGNTVEDQYPQLFTGLGSLKKPYNIQLDSDARPFAVSAPRRVALPLMDKVKAELDRLQELNVIEPVTVPTEWCAPIVVVPKTNGNVRLCVDFTQLNQNVKRERYMLPAVDEMLGQMAGATVFTKLDANCGFHQVHLTPDSQLLTTFITPYGRFCYTRLPFGINSGPEHFQRQVHQVLDHAPGTACIQDDIVVYGRGTHDHDENLKRVLDKLSANKVTLNKDKCEFRKEEITVVGHVVGRDGVKADPAKVAAIQDMEEPANITELRSFLGMVNQLGKFLPEVASMTEPLRTLLSTKIDWYWGQAQTDAFRKVKDLVSKTPVLALYDPKKKTKVSADSSSYGLGAVLLQMGEDETWHPVCYASRALSKTESRYAQVEKEALAATYASTKFEKYLTGLTYVLETDHKPLVALLGSKSLDQLPPRIQRMRMRLMRFTYNIVHVPGKELYTADHLSRFPCGQPSAEDEQLAQDITVNVCQVMASLPATDQRLEEIRVHQKEDELCQKIRTYVTQGWPEKWQVEGILKQYWPHQGDLYIEDDILMYQDRLFIPSALRLSILDRIHDGHQGIVKCRRLAQQSVWWPGLSQQVEDLVKGCRTCVMNAKQPKEPLEPTEFPTTAWDKVATDLMDFKGSQYLVVIDYHSRFIELALLESTTSKAIINHMKSIFARHGIPTTVVSDNGPQYSSREFKEFASDWGFQHVTSSPIHPSANGEAERAVRTVKSLLTAADEPYLALLAYRRAPLASGYSPGELSMGRKLRTRVPMAPKKLKPPDMDKVLEHEAQGRSKMKLTHDIAHRAAPLPALKGGDEVYLPDRKESGVVTSRMSPRSYHVKTPVGTYRRNRRHINKMPTPAVPAPGIPAPQTPTTHTPTPHTPSSAHSSSAHSSSTHSCSMRYSECASSTSRADCDQVRPACESSKQDELID